MRKVFKYGTMRFEGAKAGEPVRFVDAPSAGQTGAILAPRGPHEVNAVLVKVDGSLGYVEIKPRLTSAKSASEAASASGIRVNLPVSAGGSLKIS